MRRILVVFIAVVAAIGGAVALATGRSSAKPRLQVKPAHSRLLTACRASSCGAYAALLDWSNINRSDTTGYYTFANGIRVGAVRDSPFTFRGMACGTSYTLGVEPHDGSGNHGRLYTARYTTPACDSGGPSTFVSEGFYPAYQESLMPLSNVPWATLTELANFSMMAQTASPYLNTTAHGMTPSEQRRFVQAVHQHGKLALLAIGGADDRNWNTACAAANRSTFINAIAHQVKTYGYDGVDLDIEQGTGSAFPQTDFNNCVTGIHNALKAFRTARGGVPLLTEDEVPDWQPSMIAPVAQYLDQIGLMGYQATCASRCSAWRTFIANNTTRGIPASKLLLGMATESGFAHVRYSTRGATSSSLSTGGPISSIPVAALSAAIPAGNIVLGTADSRPVQSQVFVTSGAARGATSIPVTPQTPNHPYPSGSLVIDDYSGPPDCGNVARYAAQRGVAGVAVWTVPDDAANHHGQTPCMNALGPYVRPPAPAPQRLPAIAAQPLPAAATPDPMTLISQGVPSHSEGTAVYPVGNVNDRNYSTEYRCTSPCAADLDLSGVPSGERQQIVFSWYNQDNTFQDVAEGVPAYNEPRDFTIDVNSAPGGGRPPAAGWTALKSIAGNLHDAGQYVLNLNGANWIRMRVTASNGSPGNTDASWQMDVASAGQGTNDTWLFLGDSITNNSMSQREPGNFFESIHASKSAYWPSQVNGGMSTWSTASFLATNPATGKPYITDFLDAFPDAHFVTLNLGSNDVGPGVPTSTFLSHLETLVQDVISAGRVPIVPTIPWGPRMCNANLASNNPAIPGTANYAIVHTLYPKFPQVIPGPDLWTYFNNHPSLIATSGSPGCPHPTSPTGENDYRQLWVDTMLRTAYR